MNKQIQKGFSVKMEISNIGSIKPVASGTFKNDSGEQIKYKASIQFKTTNIQEIEDEELGLKEVETHIIVKIPCEQTSDVKKLNEFLRGFKERGEILNLDTTLPRQSDAGVYNVVSTLNATEFMAQNSKGSLPKK